MYILVLNAIRYVIGLSQNVDLGSQLAVMFRTSFQNKSVVTWFRPRCITMEEATIGSPHI